MLVFYQGVIREVLDLHCLFPTDGSIGEHHQRLADLPAHLQVADWLVANPFPLADQGSLWSWTKLSLGEEIQQRQLLGRTVGYLEVWTLSAGSVRLLELDGAKFSKKITF